MLFWTLLGFYGGDGAAAAMVVKCNAVEKFALLGKCSRNGLFNVVKV